MAHSLSAQKRIRQNEKHRALNRWRLKTMRDAVKEFRDKIAHGSVKDAEESFKKTARLIDRTAQKGVIRKGQAARRKSRMSAAVKSKKASGAKA